jgi:hypothetical protein
MKSRLGGSEWNPQPFGYLGQWQADVVVKDEYGPLLERQPAKGTIELIAVVDGQDLGRIVVPLQWQDANLGTHAPSTPGLGIALVREDPMEPGFEGIRITKRPELTPAGDERGLHRVLRPIGVAQDPERNRHAPIADRASEGVEGLSVAPFRSVYQLSVHPTLPLTDRARWARSD